MGIRIKILIIRKHDSGIETCRNSRDHLGWPPPGLIYALITNSRKTYFVLEVCSGRGRVEERLVRGRVCACNGTFHPRVCGRRRFTNLGRKDNGCHDRLSHETVTSNSSVSRVSQRYGTKIGYSHHLKIISTNNNILGFRQRNTQRAFHNAY
ncbi:hypothetical protein CEXT_658401 [Caerostris extrusa]|uniref:Uncharacterized protein n=1 Tax=Caerostris extrusa TaxID=172846 RepID=A0AAV4R4F0_CAEEX|nr:hypothetical protein CEXT_658401 [Caerostris extrusa]